jgi:4-hydroxy-tetrahydrodipicolinate synthase
MQLHGCYTALITPFNTDLSVDISAFEAFVEWQISQGVHGIVPCGTTGESPTLNHAEHKKLVEVAVKVTAGRAGVMAGTGSNSTTEAIDFTRHAEKAGANSVLVVAPYYNKPTQEGLFQHYKAIAESTALPVIIYNIPGRSVINIADSTLAKLAESCPNIAGIKDATGDLARVASLRHLVGDRLTLFSGEDITAVGFNAMGGKGVISVTSNIMPGIMAEIQNLCVAGEFVKARTLSESLTALHQVMFCETNPAPVKYAASLMGKCRPSLRLPLVEPTEANKAAIAAVLKNAGLLTRNAA